MWLVPRMMVVAVVDAEATEVVEVVVATAEDMEGILQM